jgi:hypothetical protein
MSQSQLAVKRCIVVDYPVGLPHCVIPCTRYCSTAPECEFQLQFGRQLIRLRALNPESRAQWIRALGGER